MKRIEEKIENGKLVCIDMESENGKITKIIISGDFFIHPEESIDKIEQSLVGVKITDKSEKEIEELIARESQKTEYLGVKPADFARLIKKLTG
ncbi:hypothetical protein HY990_01515 [Candidatus Micrarchaeota archaeon]|nr:hypothetical protein [Candidatus Micrarchaeota archaeon]